MPLSLSFPLLFSEYSVQRNKVKQSLNSGTKLIFIKATLKCILTHCWILPSYCTITIWILTNAGTLTCTSNLSLVILWKGRMRNEVKDRPLTRGWFSSAPMASRNAWFPSLDSNSCWDNTSHIWSYMYHFCSVKESHEKSKCVYQYFHASPLCL